MKSELTESDFFLEKLIRILLHFTCKLNKNPKQYGTFFYRSALSYAYVDNIHTYINIIHIIFQYFTHFKVHDFSFVQTVDLFFKIHLVLQQNFEPSLKNMMLFIQYAVFGFPEKDFNATSHMKAVSNMLH